VRKEYALARVFRSLDEWRGSPQAREVAMTEVKTKAKDALVSTGLLLAQTEVGTSHDFE
jgi:hypothetical protein